MLLSRGDVYAPPTRSCLCSSHAEQFMLLPLKIDLKIDPLIVGLIKLTYPVVAPGAQAKVTLLDLKYISSLLFRSVMIRLSMDYPPLAPSVFYRRFIERVAYIWDSLGPSPALALSHITARLTVPYRSSVH